MSILVLKSPNGEWPNKYTYIHTYILTSGTGHVTPSVSPLAGNLDLKVYYVYNLQLTLKICTECQYGIVKGALIVLGFSIHMIFFPKEIVTLTAICAFGGITSISISNGHLEDTVPLTGSQDQTGITPQVLFRKKKTINYFY